MEGARGVFTDVHLTGTIDDNVGPLAIERQDAHGFRVRCSMVSISTAAPQFLVDRLDDR